MARYAMVIDLEKCVGCQACTVACNSEWDVPIGFARTHVRPTGVAGTFPNLVNPFTWRNAITATDPACVPACPTGATYQAENGIVHVDRDLCIGCGYCVEACPYGARYISPTLKKVDKCDFCAAAWKRAGASLRRNLHGARQVLRKPGRHVERRFRHGVREGARRLESTEVAIGPERLLPRQEGACRPGARQLPAASAACRCRRVWSKVVKPSVFVAVGATFLGQAVAFFRQLAPAKSSSRTRRPHEHSSHSELPVPLSPEQAEAMAQRQIKKHHVAIMLLHWFNATSGCWSSPPARAHRLAHFALHRTGTSP